MARKLVYLFSSVVFPLSIKRFKCSAFFSLETIVFHFVKLHLNIIVHADYCCSEKMEPWNDKRCLLFFRVTSNKKSNNISIEVRIIACICLYPFYLVVSIILLTYFFNWFVFFEGKMASLNSKQLKIFFQSHQFELMKHID